MPIISYAEDTQQSINDNAKSDDGMLDLRDPSIQRRLIDALCYAFNISDGAELPFLLGHGECANNREAITAWVSQQISGLEQQGPNVVFQQISQNLSEVLENR